MFNLKKEDILLIDQYIFQLKKTNNFFNLVGRSTLTNPWERHICDSLQLSEFIKNKKSRILDMGSGAGIPGIPLSIIGYENIVMVEAKNKKANFIKEVIFSLKLKEKVINTRLEELNK
jgi:Predicted S-adenosylmethionine-dependent methyltransferase involved in bacterial cell division